MTRTLAIIVIGVFLTGCGKHYWQETGRGVSEFQTNSGQCIQEAKTKYEVSERIYRRCMRAQGWERVQTHYPTNRQFRGPEDEEDFFSPPDPLSARGPASSASASTQPMAAAVAPAVGDLKALVGTWTGTMTGGGELRVRHEVTFRLFEEGGEICWEGHRQWATGESRGSGTVALAEDGVVLSGQRRESGSSRVFPVALTLIRRGRTLEGTVLGSDNRVYIIVVTRNQ